MNQTLSLILTISSLKVNNKLSGTKSSGLESDCTSYLLDDPGQASSLSTLDFLSLL
jgi:hypothetical protein